MKIRTDFVTNSSSSSFVCVAKVDYNDELRVIFQREYGNYGLRLLERLLEKGSDIKDSCQSSWIAERLTDEAVEKLNDDAYYLAARFIGWSTDGDIEEADAWLYEHIPPEFLHEFYSSNE